MRDQPGQNKGYKGFKPMQEDGKLRWPGDYGELKLTQNEDKEWLFLDAPENSILWHALFYNKDAAIRVHDYLARANILGVVV
jgi:hypothetical protein